MGQTVRFDFSGSSKSPQKEREILAATLTSELQMPAYRMMDVDDVHDVAHDEVAGVLDILSDARVLSDDQKAHAAAYMGQYLLDGLAIVETQRIAEDARQLVAEFTRKPYAVMAQIPDYITPNVQEAING